MIVYNVVSIDFIMTIACNLTSIKNRKIFIFFKKFEKRAMKHQHGLS